MESLSVKDDTLTEDEVAALPAIDFVTLGMFIIGIAPLPFILPASRTDTSRNTHTSFSHSYISRVCFLRLQAFLSARPGALLRQLSRNQYEISSLMVEQMRSNSSPRRHLCAMFWAARGRTRLSERAYSPHRLNLLLSGGSWTKATTFPEA